MTPKEYATALIYDQAAPSVDFAAIAQVFLAEAGLSNKSYSKLQDVSDSLLWLTFEEGFFVKLEIMREPCQIDGFRRALSTPLAQMLPTDFEGIISRNQEYILITVGDGEGIIPQAALQGEGIMEIMRRTGIIGNETPEQSRARLRFLNILTRHVFSLGEPSLIHFTNSEMLLEPATYAGWMTEELSINQFTQPILYSSSGQLAQDAPLGVNLLGSADFLGKPVSLTEAPLPLDYVVEIPSIFVRYCLHIGKILDQGETFGKDENQRILVTHHGRSAARPDGEIELTVMQDEKLPDGYVAKAPVPRSDEAEVENSQEAAAPAKAPDEALAAAFRGTYGVSDVQPSAKNSPSQKPTKPRSDRSAVANLTSKLWKPLILAVVLALIYKFLAQALVS